MVSGGGSSSTRYSNSLAELLERQAGGGGELRQLVRVVEVVAPQPDHVAAGDRVARRVRRPPCARGCGRSPGRAAARTGSARSGRPASRSSRRCRPRAGTSPRSSRGRACTPCRTGSGRRSAARSRCSWPRCVVLMPNGLRRSRTCAFRISPMLTSSMRTWPCASRSTSSSCGQVRGVDAEHQPFGDDGHAVAPAVAEPLDDGAHQGVHDRLEPDRLARELLGDQREGGARRLADAEREVAGLAAHRDHEVPARGGLGVHHQVLDDLDADVARGLEAEGVHVRRQVEVVVDGLGHVDDADAARAPSPRASWPRTPCRRRRW